MVRNVTDDGDFGSNVLKAYMKARRACRKLPFLLSLLVDVMVQDTVEGNRSQIVKKKDVSPGKNGIFSYFL